MASLVAVGVALELGARETTIGSLVGVAVGNSVMVGTADITHVVGFGVGRDQGTTVHVGGWLAVAGFTAVMVGAGAMEIGAVGWTDASRVPSAGNGAETALFPDPVPRSTDRLTPPTVAVTSGSEAITRPGPGLLSNAPTENVGVETRIAVSS